MSGDGPPFPRPVPGSNAIGRFQVGLSQIGTIPVMDPWSTVFAQYANSSAITGVIMSFFAALDITKWTDDFFDSVFNISTAYGAGLDTWGNILQVSRILKLPAATYFGFNEALPGVDTFGFGTFFSPGNATNNYALSDSQYRILLLAKTAANISDGSIKSINMILMGLFPNRGNAYCQDNQDQTMEYVFTFPLSTVELAIVQQSGVLPKPPGVAASVIVP